ncbi:MAG: hypothetical protein R2941_18705 [Desulfobacterales bacterium]
MSYVITMPGRNSSIADRNTAHDSCHGSGRTAGFVWNATKTSAPDVRSVTVIAKDCPMIFSKAVGVLSLNDFDILDARSYRQNSSTLGAFKIKALPGFGTEADRLLRAQDHLKGVLNGTLNLRIAFRKKMSARTAGNPKLASRRPLEAAVDNDSSFLFTLVEVKADDFPGVLFTVADAILRCDLDIWNAKITTAEGRICDTFYVKKLTGQKVGSDKEASLIRAALRNAYNMLTY